VDFIERSKFPYVEPMSAGSYWRWMACRAGLKAFKVADWTPGKIVAVAVAFVVGASIAYFRDGSGRAAEELGKVLLSGLASSCTAVAVLFLLYLIREPYRFTVELVGIVASLEGHLRKAESWRDVELELARANSMAETLLNTRPTAESFADWQEKYVRWCANTQNTIAMNLGPTWADKFYSVDTLASGELKLPNFKNFAIHDEHLGSLEFLFARKRNLISVMNELDRRAVEGTPSPPVPPLSDILRAQKGRPGRRRASV
jgi:hypothetical protein